MMFYYAIRVMYFFSTITFISCSQDDESVAVFAPGNKKTPFESTESGSTSTMVNGCSSMTASSGSEKLDTEPALSACSSLGSRPDIENSVAEKSAQDDVSPKSKHTESNSERTIPAAKPSSMPSYHTTPDGVLLVSPLPETDPASIGSQLPDVSQVPPDIIRVSRPNNSPDVSLVTTHKSAPSCPDVSHVPDEASVTASEGGLLFSQFHRH